MVFIVVFDNKRREIEWESVRRHKTTSTTTTTYIRTITTVKQQLAHKLCLMNFNDAFCSYLFGEKPITINSAIDSL